jgi:ribose transport system ATP-binding protein
MTTTSEDLLSGDEVLKLSGICKQFPGVVALDHVDLSLYAGEVHALLGENGAGKSTLIKIVSGAYVPDDGEIRLLGNPVSIPNPHRALQLGISTIYQELTLVPDMSVAENILLGRVASRRALPGVVDWRKLRAQAQEALDLLQIPVSPDALASTLAPAQQRMVEIARAFVLRSRVVIIDEPTAALSDRETELLMSAIHSLRTHNVGVIYISHRLEEAQRIADRATVLRNGVVVKTVPMKETSVPALIRLMVGREMRDRFPKIPAEIGEPLLRVVGLSRAGAFQDVSFDVRAGEIVGMAGLVGAGRSEVARAIFGIDALTKGEVWVEGQRRDLRSPAKAIRSRIGLLPEERKEQGLLLSFSPVRNITLPILSRLTRAGFIAIAKEAATALQYSNRLRIKGGASKAAVEYLSGGNQQKVVLAKWLCSQAKVFLFDEPTRGIDVGAKVEVYELMNELVAQGAGILFISSELPEILGMSDRILVMASGRLTGSFAGKQASEEQVLAAAFSQGTESGN